MSKDETKKKIKETIEGKGSASLAELKKLGNRQTINYNLRQLCREKVIRPSLNIREDNGFVCPRDDEIFFTFANNYEYPQDVTNLVDEMCVKETNLASQKLKEFLALCLCQGIHDYVARKLAFALMSGLVPNLKEKISFELTFNKGLVAEENILVLLREQGLIPPLSDEFPAYTAKDFDDGKED